MPWWCYEIKINDVLRKYSANFVEKWAPSSQSDWKKTALRASETTNGSIESPSYACPTSFSQFNFYETSEVIVSKICGFRTNDKEMKEAFRKSLCNRCNMAVTRGPEA